MTAHLSDEELLDYRYGETRSRSAAEAHLRACSACRARYEAFERVLAAVDAAPVPEPAPDYEQRVWQRLRPRLEEPRREFAWLAWLEAQRWAAVAGVAVLVVAAFLAGRLLPRRGTPAAEAISPQARDRILLVAVGDHLDRTQMVLMELVNADGTPAGGSVDISSERRRAKELVASNRLYRQTAAHTGESAVANLLDELEPLLVQIAHSPDRISPTQLEEFRQRLAARGILFKVRVIGSEVRAREKSATAQAGPGKS